MVVHHPGVVTSMQVFYYAMHADRVYAAFTIVPKTGRTSLY